MISLASRLLFLLLIVFCQIGQILADNSPACLHAISSNFSSHFEHSGIAILSQDLEYYKKHVKEKILGSNTKLVGDLLTTDQFLLPLNSIPESYTKKIAFESAVINNGDSSQFDAVTQKVLNKQCIQILVVGGSITCGGSQNKVRPDGPDGPRDAWPKKLQALLQKTFGLCTGIGTHKHHVVINACVGGAGTSHWVDSFASWKADPKHPVHTSDLIIVESSVNDFEFHNDLLISTELLIHVLRSFKAVPALMWLSVSTIEVLPWNGRGNSALDHKLLTGPYGIPHLSVTDGFYPFDSDLKKYWYLDIYRSDARSHVSSFGHKLIAFYIHDFFKYLYCRSSTLLRSSTSSAISPLSSFDRAESKEGIAPRIDPSKMTPLFASAEDIGIYTKKIPYKLALYTSIPVWDICMKNIVGFTQYADVPNKFGYIATTVGSKIMMTMPAKNLYNQPFQKLKIEFLTSYTSMGTFCVDLFEVLECHQPMACVMPVGEGVTQILHSTVDSLSIGHNVSISKTVSFDFSSFRWSNAKCKKLRLDLQVIRSNPYRSKNKVKLLAVLLY